MKKLLILIPLFLNGGGLKSLLNSANSSNLVKAKQMQVLSKQKELSSQISQDFPTVDLSAAVVNSNPRGFMQPGTIYKASVVLSYTIYDGGLKSAKKVQKRFELASVKFDKSFFTKSLYLQIVQDYYNIKSLDALIDALYSKKRAIKEQLNRVAILQKSGLANSDDLYSLKAALALVKDNISSLNYQKKSLIAMLNLKANSHIKRLGNSLFVKRSVKFKDNDLIASLKAKRSAILSSAKMASSATKPHINLNASYSLYGYDRVDRLHPKGLDKDTKVTLIASVRLFDGGAAKESAEAIKLQAMALNYQIKHKHQEQLINFKLSYKKLSVAREHIKALKEQYRASSELFKTVKTKYEAGLSDYANYLNALSQKTLALAELKKAKYELEIAYALYYYYAGYDLRRFVAGE